MPWFFYKSAVVLLARNKTHDFLSKQVFLNKTMFVLFQLMLIVSFVCLLMGAWPDKGTYTFYCIFLVFGALISAYLLFTVIAGTREKVIFGEQKPQTIYCPKHFPIYVVQPEMQVHKHKKCDFSCMAEPHFAKLKLKIAFGS